MFYKSAADLRKEAESSRPNNQFPSRKLDLGKIMAYYVDYHAYNYDGPKNNNNA
jgi:hypothetical protein